MTVMDSRSGTDSVSDNGKISLIIGKMASAVKVGSVAVEYQMKSESIMNISLVVNAEY